MNNLIIEGSKGKTQPVEVEFISPSTYRILFSPELVEDIAAGDIIRATDKKSDRFEVV